MIKYPLTLILLGLAVLASSKLVFEDNFDKFDFTKWKHDITLSGGGNWEFQLYENNRSTSFVKNGKLNIKPILTEDKIGANSVRNGFTYDVWGGSPVNQCTGNNFYGCSRASNGNNYINPVMSAKVTTVNSFSFKYGRIQVRAKLPKGDWLWPAIWLLPRYNEYGDWPASGQIDIMESRGNVGYPKSAGGGPQTVASTLHWGPDYSKNFFQKTHAEHSLNSGTFADDFHTFGLYWDQNQLFTYVDSESNKILQVNTSSQSFWQKTGLSGRDNPWETSSNKGAPFDTNFYIIINLAVGGNAGYFPDGVGNKPWSDSSARSSSEFYDNKGQWWGTWSNTSSVFQIDSVKVWDLTGNQKTEVITQ